MNKRLLSLLSLSLTATILATPTTVQAQNHPPITAQYRTCRNGQGIAVPTSGTLRERT